MRTNEEDLHKIRLLRKRISRRTRRTVTQQHRNNNAYTEYLTRRTNSWIINDNKNNGINGDSR